MVNYLQKFAPNLSEATAPTRELLKVENPFLLDEAVQGRSFKPVKQLIVESPKQTLNFNVMHLTKVLVHASNRMASQWAMLQERRRLQKSTTRRYRKRTSCHRKGVARGSWGACDPLPPL